MTSEQLPSKLERRPRSDVEIDVVVREVEALALAHDLDVLRMAVRVMSEVPHFKPIDGVPVAESLRDQILRELRAEDTR